jgi:hypothetical protein
MEVILSKLASSTTGRFLLLVFIALFLLSFTPFQASAQTEEPVMTANGEMWLQSTGAGNAVLNLTVPQAFIEMGFTLDAMVEQMQQDESAEVTSAQDLGGGNFRIAFRWTDPHKFFGEEMVTINPDGTITIDLGDLSSFETLTVHVQGNITETVGQKTANDTAVFKGSPTGTITFKPSGALPPTSQTPPPTGTPPATTPPPGTTQTPQPTPTGGPAPSGGGLSTTWIIIIAFGALFVLAIIVLLVSLSARKRRPPQAGYPYPPPPPPQAGPAPGYMFCPNCGKQVPVGTKFCTYCGFQIGAPPTPPQQQPPPPPPETPQS